MKLNKRIKFVPDVIELAIVNVCATIEELTYKQYEKTHCRIFLHINTIAFKAGIKVCRRVMNRNVKRYLYIVKKDLD